MGIVFDQSLNTTDSPSFVDGDFSGIVTANTITSDGGNLTLQRNSADSIALGGTFIQCYHEIRPATNNLYSNGTLSLRWSNVASVDGDFSGTLSAVTVAGQTNNLTLQSNSGNALISISESGSISLTAFSSIYQQFTVDGVGYRQSLYPIFSGLDMATAATPWDTGYIDNIVSGAGGAVKLYNLGTEGDTDTEFVSMGWDSNDFTLLADKTGAGTIQDFDITGSQVALKHNSGTGVSTRLSTDSTSIKVYRNFYNGVDGLYSCGLATNRWSSVYSINGDFSGTVDINNTTGWSATIDRGIRVGPESGISWYYGNGNQTKISTAVTFESNFQFARAADGITSRLYRMTKDATAFTLKPVDGGSSGSVIFQVEDATDTFQPLRTGGIINHYPNNAGQQAYRMYNLGEIGDADTEYGGFDFTSNVFRLGTHTTGSGVARDVGIIRDGSYKMYFSSTVTTTYQSLLPSVPAAMNLGSTTINFARTFSQAVFSNIQTITAASDSLVTTDTTNLCDCTLNQIDITIPTSSSDYVGNEYVIKKIDASANTVVITPTSRTIEGAASLTLTTQYESVSIISDGTNWFIKHQT